MSRALLLSATRLWAVALTASLVLVVSSAVADEPSGGPLELASFETTLEKQWQAAAIDLTEENQPAAARPAAPELADGGRRPQACPDCGSRQGCDCRKAAHGSPHADGCRCEMCRPGRAHGHGCGCDACRGYGPRNFSGHPARTLPVHGGASVYSGYPQFYATAGYYGYTGYYSPFRNYYSYYFGPSSYYRPWYYYPYHYRPFYGKYYGNYWNFYRPWYTHHYGPWAGYHVVPHAWSYGYDDCCRDNCDDCRRAGGDVCCHRHRRPRAERATVEETIEQRSEVEVREEARPRRHGEPKHVAGREAPCHHRGDRGCAHCGFRACGPWASGYVAPFDRGPGWGGGWLGGGWNGGGWGGSAFADGYAAAISSGYGYGWGGFGGWGWGGTGWGPWGWRGAGWNVGARCPLDGPSVGVFVW